MVPQRIAEMIMNRTLERTGAAPSDFVQRLVGQDSELAQQVAKDPYNFEFPGLSGEVAERYLVLALANRIAETLRKLGQGFSFVGRQVHFGVDGDDYYVDMLSGGQPHPWQSPPIHTTSSPPPNSKPCPTKATLSLPSNGQNLTRERPSPLRR
ncbi:conserved hypothetical protein [Paenarthrobacter aurescens TC1]|uniref:YhcG PDDEXK nuclease domain-containing protein n=1 Tax=Paenarthrobacter aurescens (strain TC1) TaxID=290340 RepID=A1RAM9_PAEAT|nr:conserved hypothetical protein [Paenarthrobacter aurescens TC1]